ncbi:hypothetical protein HHL22_21545 [Hymenobacter sp. RP-2-7]|uniref:Periplasmic heavy metal sensor n=1 Tax=Hymenobacter polaris TaxID=2682546 RepID=A0A7Y0AI92_9BACT|nr:hypothetical protein [Hymenobacter polaris]NML67795.1 hypothetical protein [Hymenobacter polaris]
MKNLLLLALLPALPALAQTAPSPLPANVGVRRVIIGSDTPPEPQADAEAARLTGQLGLSPAQATQVRAAALVQYQARQAKLRRLEAAHAQGRIPLDAEDKAIEDNFEAQLHAICTPEQYQKHQLIRARFRRLRARADSLRQAGPAPVAPH